MEGGGERFRRGRGEKERREHRGCFCGEKVISVFVYVCLCVIVCVLLFVWIKL